MTTAEAIALLRERAVLNPECMDAAKKRYRGKLRLVRVTRETIEPPNASFRGGP